MKGFKKTAQTRQNAQKRQYFISLQHADSNLSGFYYSKPDRFELAYCTRQIGKGENEHDKSLEALEDSSSA